MIFRFLYFLFFGKEELVEVMIIESRIHLFGSFYPHTVVKTKDNVIKYVDGYLISHSTSSGGNDIIFEETESSENSLLIRAGDWIKISKSKLKDFNYRD